MASPLEHNLNYLHYWSKHPRDRIFGATHNALSSKFSGFSSCHPIYDDHVVLLTLKHAIYSAILQTDATATCMLLLSWDGPMSTNLYPKHLTAYHHLCCTLGAISSTKLSYETPHFWVSKEFTFPAIRGA
eukprot:1159802-Pelagomonas_calceolata.AAC.3